VRVSGTTPALIAAAAGVGFGHAILPDHWVPLALIGRTRRYPLARVARLSGLAGIAHVAVSVLLGAVIVAVGLQFRSVVLHAEDAIVGGVLVATGILFALYELTGHEHRHAHGEGHTRAHAQDQRALRGDHGARSGRSQALRRTAGVMVPFGAAASPDLTILPVFLAAAAAGAGAAIGSLVAFALATIGTFVVLTVGATLGGYQLRTRWLDRSAGAITAAVLIVIGGLVASSVI
jgi:nickel/cobalt transporter (NicO) family protein